MALIADARAHHQRRLLVLSGSHASTISACREVLSAISVGITDTIVCGTTGQFQCEQLPPARSKELMGTTQSVVIVDLFETMEPNVLGRATGAVDGGGLLILLAPTSEKFLQTSTAFDHALTAERYTVDDVGTGYKRRLRDSLRAHEGIEWIDVDSGSVITSNEAAPANETTSEGQLSIPTDRTFPAKYYEACRTQEQITALRRCERLRSPDTTIVVSAERGRGKSSLGGIASAAMAATGYRIGVTAPRPENVQAFFARISELHASWAWENGDRLHCSDGGSIQYVRPADAGAAIENDQIDCLVVDEAAGIPVHLLTAYLELDRLVFLTTLHGYEGAGHGFSTRFQEALARTGGDTHSLSLAAPIRYAPGDPIERWITHTLLLDARPPVADVLKTATPATVSVSQISRTELETNEALLAQVQGLLATAHYRTTPNDLARILDAPNLTLYGALIDGFPAGIALVAAEGGITDDRLAEIDEGDRLHGNMIPEMSHLQTRDSALAGTLGHRIVRIATHEAVRRRCIATALIEHIRESVATGHWLGAGFGARPGVIDFWQANGFVPVLLSTTRNATSGNYSVVMLDRDATDASIFETQTTGFLARFRATLTDGHRELSPATVRSIIEAVASPYPVEMTRRERDILRTAASGTGSYAIDPRGAKTLLLGVLSDPTLSNPLDDRETSLLIEKILQGRSWEHIVSTGEYPSVRTARIALGEALGTLCASSAIELRDERI